MGQKERVIGPKPAIPLYGNIAALHIQASRRLTNVIRPTLPMESS